MTGTNSLDFRIFESEDQLATEITRFWETWRNARLEWIDRAQEVEQYLYATSTHETTNVINDHRHSTHVPKLTQIADNLEANYMSALNLSGDWLRFEGSDYEGELYQKKKAVLAYIDTKNKLNNFTRVINSCVRDFVIYGNAFAGVTYVAEFHDDPTTGERIPGYIGPKIYRISPYDIVFNPFATDFQSSPKIIRTLKSLGELHRDAQENPTLGYSQEIIDRITDERSRLNEYRAEEINKHLQLQFDGFGSPSQYYNSGNVEILELFGDIYDIENEEWLKNYVITIVDRRYVVRKQPLNTWTGRPPIFHVTWRQRTDNLWGMGPLDNLVGMQYYIDHLENARADAFDQMIDADRKIYGDVEVESRGAAIDYYITEGGDVTFLAPDTTVLNADFEIQKKEDQMEEFAGAPRQAMGIRTPGEKTAFEVQQLHNAASRIFQSKITHFEENFLEPIVNAEIETARRNLQFPDLVKVIDDDFGVAEFLQVTPEDLRANGKLIPVGARHFARQATLAQNLQQFMAAMQQDPMMALHFPSERLAKTWEDLLGFKRLELFEKFGRIDEEVEVQRLKAAAQQQLQEEQQVPMAASQGAQQQAQGQPDFQALLGGQ